MSYSDQRYGASQEAYLAGQAAAGTSTYAADSEVSRITFMSAVDILDFNVQMTTGATYTSVAPQIIKIGKSFAGTGTITDLGTAILHTSADLAMLDGTLTTSGYYAGTANHLAAGDDLVLEVAAGTAAATGEPQIKHAHVEYRERFAEGDSA
jgi:hypothetical protein